MSLPRPVLIDMPWHIKQKIVGHTDNITRLVLRKTTKEFRKQVDCSPYPANFKTVAFRVYKKRVIVDFYYGDKIFTVEYRKADFHCIIKWSDDSRIICGKFDHIEQAVADIATIFANRRASVKEFHVCHTEYVDRSVKRSLKTFPKNKASFLNAIQKKFSQLPELARIEIVDIEWSLNESEMMKLIPFLNAKSLKKLELKATLQNTMKNIFVTEQFRNLNILMLDNGNRVFSSFVTAKLPPAVLISGATATTAELAVLLENVLQNSKEFDHLDLWNVDYNMHDFLNHVINLHQLDRDDQAEEYIIKMPNSKGWLAITFRSTDLFFEKVYQVLGPGGVLEVDE